MRVWRTLVSTLALPAAADFYTVLLVAFLVPKMFESWYDARATVA